MITSGSILRKNWSLFFLKFPYRFVHLACLVHEPAKIRSDAENICSCHSFSLTLDWRRSLKVLPVLLYYFVPSFWRWLLEIPGPFFFLIDTIGIFRNFFHLLWQQVDNPWFRQTIRKYNCFLSVVHWKIRCFVPVAGETLVKNCYGLIRFVYGGCPGSRMFVYEKMYE